MTKSQQYGDVVPRTHVDTMLGYVSIIGEVTTAPSGNVVLRIGRKDAEGWQKTEHVVLTPEEARRFAVEVISLAAGH